MKILHVIDHMEVGGAQKMVYDISLLQQKNGHQVKILALIHSGSFLETDLKKKGIEISFVYANSSNLKSIYNPLTIWKLRKYLVGTDIIHVHLFPANYWCAIYKTLFERKLKIITTEHSTNNKRRNKSYLKPIERFVYSKYDAVVACSQKAQNTLNDFLGKSLVKFISNGVNVETFSNAEAYSKAQAYGLSDDSKIITMVARFQLPKDQNTVVKSLTYLPDYVHVAFVGDGALKNECEQYALELGVAERCHFLGVRSDVPKLVKTSDINVLSSKWEGLSLSSVECMAASKPFIGTNVQGIKEVVAAAGLLFEYGDAKRLATCIKELLDSQDLYHKVAKHCYQRAKDYDILKTYQAYMDCYNNL